MRSFRWTFAILLASFMAMTSMSTLPPFAEDRAPPTVVHMGQSTGPGANACQPGEMQDRCCGTLHCIAGILIYATTMGIAGVDSGAFASNSDSPPFLTVNRLDRPPKT